MRKRLIISSIVIFLINVSTVAAKDNVVNVYNWSSYIPAKVLKLFTKQTGIKVNYSTYDNNETLYAKLKADPKSGYDLVVPSSFVVSRMIREDMLHRLDKSQLPNFKYINSKLLNKPYDPYNRYSIPYLWGTSGLIVNKNVYHLKEVSFWTKLWHPRFKNKVAIEDDVRDVFGMAFITLGYSINDKNPEHIKQAYLKLRQLLPNILVFTIDGAQQLFVNEDANIGMVNSGDAISIIAENPNFVYVYPKDGVLLWIDNMVVPKYAIHLHNAYVFMNFIMQPKIAKMISEGVGYASPNLGALKLMSKSVRNDHLLYPDKKDLKYAQIETDLSRKTKALYMHYWELLKLGT